MAAAKTVYSVEGGFVGLVKAYFGPNIPFLQLLMAVLSGSLRPVLA